MIVTKKAMSRRTVLRGLGTALSLPLLDAMVPALTAVQNTPAKAVPRLGVVYHPNGVIYENWLPTGVGARVRALAGSGAARAVPRSADRGHGAVEPSGGGARRRRRRSLARHWHLPDRRPRPEIRQRRRQQRVDGPDCGQVLRARDAALLAAADGGRQQPGGVLRCGLQLRLQQHLVVAHADPAADGGKQSARRLRADVRVERQHRSARARVASAPGPEHPRFGHRPRPAASAETRPARQHEGERLPRVAA